MDRRSAARARRAVLPAEVHPSRAEEHVVARQPREGARPHRAWPDAAGRAQGGGASQGRRSLGGRLRAAIDGHGARRPAAAAGRKPPSRVAVPTVERREELRGSGGGVRWHGLPLRVVARQRATPPSNAPASIWLSMNATAAATPSRTAQATCAWHVMGK